MGSKWVDGRERAGQIGRIVKRARSKNTNLTSERASYVMMRVASSPLPGRDGSYSTDLEAALHADVRCASEPSELHESEADDPSRGVRAIRVLPTLFGGRLNRSHMSEASKPSDRIQTVHV